MTDRESPPPGVSWHIYVDRRLCDFSKQMDERFAGQQEAVRRANEANNRAFEKVNEFRAALSDQNERFVTNDALSALQVRLTFLEKNQSVMEGKQTEAAKNTRMLLGIGVLLLAALQVALALWS